MHRQYMPFYPAKTGPFAAIFFDPDCFNICQRICREPQYTYVLVRNRDTIRAIPLKQVPVFIVL